VRRCSRPPLDPRGAAFSILCHDAGVREETPRPPTHPRTSPLLPGPRFPRPRHGFLARVAAIALALAATSSRAQPPRYEGSAAYFVDPDTAYRPKDFAFFCNTVPTATPNSWRRLFHLIYTRESKHGTRQTTFGHAWTKTPDIPSSWQTDTSAFAAGGTPWDAVAIYAPTLLQRGGTVYMFYTGVDAGGNESIGYTSTQLLDTTNTVWGGRIQILNTSDRKPAWVAPPGGGFRASMRDPFVLEDPEHPGQLLMVYVAGNANERTLAPPTAFYRNAVGVVRSRPGTMNEWDDLGYFRSSDYAHAHTGNDESPHLFPDPAHAWPSQSAQATWRLMFTDGPAPGARSINVAVKTIGRSLGDTTLANWQCPPTRLFAYLQQDSTVFGWEATEQLRVTTGDFLGAYDDVGIAIAPMFWSGTDFNLGAATVADVGGPPGAGAAVKFALAELAPGRHRIAFRIELPAAMRATVRVYDLTGRTIRTLADRLLPAGTSTLTWDGRDDAGATPRSGMYFARLTCAAGDRSVRTPIVR
jgi:hypothetical protein